MTLDICLPRANADLPILYYDHFVPVVLMRVGFFSFLPMWRPAAANNDPNPLDLETIPYAEVEGALAMQAYEEDLIMSGHYEPIYAWELEDHEEEDW